MGEYPAAGLRAGVCRAQQTGIRLSVGEQARVDVTLAISGTTEVVQVTADASAVLASRRPRARC
ncbi:MAG: hypothetical protein R2712_08380 [Vicinamibacterales bacterium]